MTRPTWSDVLRRHSILRDLDHAAVDAGEGSSPLADVLARLPALTPVERIVAGSRLTASWAHGVRRARRGRHG